MISVLATDGFLTRPLLRAMEKLDIAAQPIDSAGDLDRAGMLIIPTANSFTRVIDGLRDNGLVGPLIRAIEGTRPVLAISAGMHLLFDVSYEEQQHVGLGVIHGKVDHFDFGSHPAAQHFTSPHQGWNQVHWAVECPVMNDLESGAYFYFDHVGHAEPLDVRTIAARTNHGLDFASVVRHGSVIGVEFLPEKSETAGERVLRNFASL